MKTWQVGSGDGVTSRAPARSGDGFGVTANLCSYIHEQLYKQLDARVGHTPAGLTTPQPPIGWREQKYVIHHLNMTHEIRSMVNGVIHVTLYDCVLRSGILITDMDNPLDAWREGVGETREPDTDVVASGELATFPGNTPFKSKEFTKHWRVYRSKKLILHPGHTHIHKVRVRPRNNFMLSDEAVLGTGNNQFIPGITTCTMIVVHGGVCNDALDRTRVGYHAAAVDVISRAYCQFQLIEKSQRMDQHYRYVGNVGTAQIMPEDEPQPTEVKMA